MVTIAWLLPMPAMAFPSMENDCASICGSCAREVISCASLVITFPLAAVILMSASKAENCSATMPWNPLKTDNTQTIAAVARAMPAMATPEMMFITWWLFFEKR